MRLVFVAFMSRDSIYDEHVLLDEWIINIDDYVELA